MEENVGPFHVPQQSIRHKLRLTSQNDKNTNSNNNNHHNHLEFPLLSVQQHHQQVGVDSGRLNLSLSTHARCAGACNATPVGPFTGYASILGRSRFLRPAQELLEDLCSENGVYYSFEKEGWKVLEDSGSLFGDDEIDISHHRCNNPTLLSMLHEVYKRYKLYCQQMQAAVTSFESVAGLANAAPFACYAIKAMFKHFHSLKNAILDHIRLTGKVFGGVNLKKGSENRSNVHYEHQQKQVVDQNILHHPVWRSQRGFPDKAVSILRTWLFEHFLHPYPSDSDKQMLAQKTGLSRSQVSNWFTNARVRLWKPMVEEMHALERKTQCSKDATTSRYLDVLNDHQFSMHPHLSHNDFQIYSHTNQDHDQDQNQETHPSKRTRIAEFPRMEQNKEHFGTIIVPCNQIPSHQVIEDSHPETANGLSWSTPAHQIVPFWLAKQ